MQERNNSKICIGPYYQSDCNIPYKQHILNGYLHLHVLQIRCLHLCRHATDVHCATKTQKALQYYQPTDQILVNRCNYAQGPIRGNLLLRFREDDGNI
jgi:hypothetical protein